MFNGGDETRSSLPTVGTAAAILALWLLAMVLWSATAGAQQAPVPGAAIAVGQPAALPAEYEEPRTYLAPWLSRPTLVQVAIVNATGVAGLASQVSVLLTDIRRLALEKQLGMRVDVVNASSTEERLPQSVIYYRDGFLRAALTIAEELPHDQRMEPMTPGQARRMGVDVEIWLGKELP
jgi:hypothetical protein